MTSPADGSELTGNATVKATVSISGTSFGVRRVIFYLDGAYLLTDYQSPYRFILPTARWLDGSHSLSVEVLMREDDFLSRQASISVTFDNNVTSVPVNNNHFQPTSGRPSADGAPFIVAAAGDGASGEVNAGKVSDLITSLNPNLFLYLGDVYEKGSPTEFYNWYGTTATYFGRLRSITDPTIGNHEYEHNVAPGYFDYWDNIPNYYSYDAHGWHFISLNSNASIVPVGAGSAQYSWLQQDLAALPADQCTIAYYHHPRFDIGSEGPTTAMAAIWSLLAKHGVDIVLNGHDHDYQRWVPLDGNGQPNANGITEFVAGGGGHGIAAIGGSDPRVAYSNSMNPSAFGVLLLQLNPGGTNFSYRNTGGAVLDSGVIPCKPAGTDSTAPATPGGLSGDYPSANRVDLSWTASSDNVGVAGYAIYRNGSAIKTVPAIQLAYSDTTVAVSTTYKYSVDAFDLAGNHSAVSPAISITTNYSLTITSTHGTVDRDDPGPYHFGDVVRLTAVPDAGWAFANWSGDATGTNNPVSITINSGKAVIAHYTPLMVTISGFVGVSGVVLTYTGGSTSSDSNGAYSSAVPYGWSGKVTPSKAGYAFSPVSLSYSGLITDQTGQDYTAHPLKTTVYRSAAAQDGWILETGESTNLGGSMGSTATTVKLGDNASRQQYRTILSFNTGGLPDNAVITGARLILSAQSITPIGSDPFSIFQGLLIDVRKGFFNTTAGLQAADFQAAADKSVGSFSPAPAGALYAVNLGSPVFPYINKLGTNAGLTQLRLRFKLDDNNNAIANFISFYSGNYGTATSRPALIIRYYVP